MQKVLILQEMVLISRIIPFPPTDPRVHEIRPRLSKPVEHDRVELLAWTLAGLPMSHTHVVTAADDPTHVRTL
jgi:hypothetical protein